MINSTVPLDSNEYLDSDIFTENYRFSNIDYGVFGTMLLISALTGLYHGCSGRKHLTTRKYIMGSDMQVFPVAMSLIASYVSGVTVLGTPAEIYNYGTQYWLIVVAIWIMGLIVSAVYLPVFHTLKVNSSYEYLELRFSSRVRTAASFMFLLDELMFLPMLVYVPALAFNQVTGLSLHLIGTIVCTVCIFYTVIGGLKAVVWTDTLQIFVMFISVVVVVIVSTWTIAGPADVINTSQDGGRIILFNTSTSLYERHTFWSVLIGGTFYWTAFNAVNQTMVQRYLSLQTLRQSRKSLGLFTVGVSVFISLCCYAGLLVYTASGDCDPRSAGLVLADDQLLPSLVVRAVGHLPGLPGLFIAGVFGAALSSLSVVLNSTAAVVLQDLVRGACGVRCLTDRQQTWLVKTCALLLGLAALGGLWVVERLGGVLAVATSLSAIAAGTTFGVFSLGMLVPWCSETGALIGAVAGAFASGWLSLGSQWASASGLLVSRALPVSVDGCEAIGLMNVTAAVSGALDESDVFPLYRMSYHWITPLGTCTTILVGMLASALFGTAKHTDPELLSPALRWFKATRYSLSAHSSLADLRTTETALSS